MLSKFMKVWAIIQAISLVAGIIFTGLSIKRTGFKNFFGAFKDGLKYLFTGEIEID